jgi:DNA-directed RNA polymerase subunit M/transcription elongation factor TFIIS
VLIPPDSSQEGPAFSILPNYQVEPRLKARGTFLSGEVEMKIAKTADRKKVMDTTKSTACPKCGKDTRIVKRVKDRERNVPGGIFISCSACEFFEKL